MRSAGRLLHLLDSQAALTASDENDRPLTNPRAFPARHGVVRAVDQGHRCASPSHRTRVVAERPVTRNWVWCPRDRLDFRVDRDQFLRFPSEHQLSAQFAGFRGISRPQSFRDNVHCHWDLRTGSDISREQMGFFVRAAAIGAAANSIPRSLVSGPQTYRAHLASPVPASTIKDVPSTICHLPFVICHCHLPFVIRHLSSAICHLPLVICHLSSAICHLPFVICHCHLPFVILHPPSPRQPSTMFPQPSASPLTASIEQVEAILRRFA